MKPNTYNDIPYELVKKLIDTYEQKEIFVEGSKSHMQCEEKILKLKGAIEYIAQGDIDTNNI